MSVARRIRRTIARGGLLVRAPSTQEHVARLQQRYRRLVRDGAGYHEAVMQAPVRAGMSRMAAAMAVATAATVLSDPEALR